MTVILANTHFNQHYHPIFKAHTSPWKYWSTNIKNELFFLEHCDK